MMKERQTWLMLVSDGERTGIGECAPLPGLSSETNVHEKLIEVGSWIQNGNTSFTLAGWSSVNFAVETALLDLENGGKRLLFSSPFTNGKKGIPINGLIWMGSAEFMLAQVKEKVDAGFHCLKLKVGGLDFFEELDILGKIRNEYRDDELEIRLDANGAFSPGDALEKLSRLSRFRIHSIEQPVKPGQLEALAEIVSQSPIPVALDEELIGVESERERKNVLETVQPDYIVLKPSLVGGFSGTGEWIHLAKEKNIRWWITSALESNIGLNAIAQWVASLGPTQTQGLGTGQVFSNNFNSPLCLKADMLMFDPSSEWDLKELL